MKKYISAIVSICMVAASVCLTSCGEDEDIKAPEQPVTPEVEVKTYSDTLKVSVSISKDLKDMLKLHYYVVDKDGEREVDEIPTINEVHSAVGTYTAGIKITSDFKPSATEAGGDFQARIYAEIKDWVKKSGKKYTEVQLEGNYSFAILTSRIRDSYSISRTWPTVEQQIKDMKESEVQLTLTEEEAFLDVAYAYVLSNFLNGFEFAYTTTITDNFNTSGHKAYTWTKY